MLPVRDETTGVVFLLQLFLLCKCLKKIRKKILLKELFVVRVARCSLEIIVHEYS